MISSFDIRLLKNYKKLKLKNIGMHHVDTTPSHMAFAVNVQLSTMGTLK